MSNEGWDGEIMKNLVFIVEEVPRSGIYCPFAKWHPNPPILEEPGY